MSTILIKNARIIDGTGNPWHSGDVRIEKDLITAVGVTDQSADTVINAENKVVAPGFIDIHTHSDIPLLVDGRAMSHITQGVTTNVIGNCGSSAAPITDINYASMLSSLKTRHPSLAVDWRSFKEYLGRLQHQGVSVNVVPLIGQGKIREAVMDHADRPPTRQELSDMRNLTMQAMQAGAFGFSSGLIYAPGSYAATAELIEIAKAVAESNGIYSTHIRGENDTLIEAVAEAIEIGRKSRIHVQISHFKAMGTHMWGASKKTLRMVADARNSGTEVTCDQYPYNASSTQLTAFLPAWVHVGGKTECMKRLRDPRNREKITSDIINGTEGWISLYKGVGWEKTIITFCKTREMEGLSVADMAKARGTDAFNAVYDLLVENEGYVGVAFFTIGDEDLERILSSDYVMVGSDSSALAVDGPLAKGKPHPRSFGTFARVLGTYVRDKKIISLESAVRKMTAFPAQTLGLYDRGLLRAGMKADVVVFDPDTVNDLATYTDPFQYAVGIEHVIVNGQRTVFAGKHLGVKAGKVLRR